MYIFLTTNEALIKSVHPGVPNFQNEFYLIISDQKLLGIFEIQELTKITGILHMHLTPEYQGKGLGIQCFNELIKMLKGGKYSHLMGTLPAENHRILSVANKTKARVCGCLTNAIIYDNKLQDLILFELEV